MRTKIGLVLLFIAVPYAGLGLFLGWQSVAMGATALIVSGGVLIARGARRKRPVPRTPSEPAIPKAPRIPTMPPPAPDGPTASPPEPERRPEGEWHEGEVILPPPPSKQAGPPKLMLVHSDGRRIDVRDFRRRAAGGSK